MFSVFWLLSFHIFCFFCWYYHSCYMAVFSESESVIIILVLKLYQEFSGFIHNCYRILRFNFLVFCSDVNPKKFDCHTFHPAVGLSPWNQWQLLSSWSPSSATWSELQLGEKEMYPGLKKNSMSKFWIIFLC